MAIRHAMTFNRQKPVVWNKTYVVNQQCNHNNNMSWVGWTIGGLSIFNTLFSGITGLITSSRAQQAQLAQQQTPQNNLEFENLKKVCKDFKYEVINNGDGTYTAYKQGSLPITGDYKMVLNTLLTLNKKDSVDGDTDSDIDIDTDTDSDMDTDLDGQGGLKEYGIDHDEGNTTLDIKKGYTWFNIVSAKYDIPDGVSAKDVALALAAANSGAEGADAMKLAHEGVFFKVGDHVDLPDSLTVNGQEISLKADHENQAVTPDNYSFVKATHWSAKVTQVGDKWYVTENDSRIGDAYDTEAAAIAAKNALIEEQNAE